MVQSGFHRFYYPVTFKVYAYSGVQGTPYTVRVNVHKQVPDSLQWLNYQQTFADGVSLQRQKAVAIDGKVYVFGVRNGETVAQYTTVSTGNPSAWQTVALPAGTDSYSVVVWKDAVWFLASNQLYQLNPGDNTYSLVANAPSLTQLVAATDEPTADKRQSCMHAMRTTVLSVWKMRSGQKMKKKHWAHLLPASVCLLPACRCHIIRLWSVPS